VFAAMQSAWSFSRKVLISFFYLEKSEGFQATPSGKARRGKNPGPNTSSLRGRKYTI